MSSKLKRILAVACCVTVSAGTAAPLALAAGCKKGYDSSYSVAYNLNYGDAHGHRPLRRKSRKLGSGQDGVYSRRVVHRRLLQE